MPLLSLVKILSSLQLVNNHIGIHLCDVKTQSKPPVIDRATETFALLVMFKNTVDDRAGGE